MLFIYFLLSLLQVGPSYAYPNATVIAKKAVVAAIDGISQDDWVHYRNFGTWSYEGGNIVRGLWEICHATGDLELEMFLHNHLNYFLQDPEQFGYRILHNESLTYNDTSIFFPWLYSIGDNIGLFPIVYADRLKYATISSAYNPQEDFYILSEVIEKYIYGYPWHLPDASQKGSIENLDKSIEPITSGGTISRPITWLAEGFISPRGGGVWVDDMFMGTSALIEWASLTGRVEHLIYSGQQITNIANYLENDRFLRHGYSYFTGHKSCCTWARGNGWALLAMVQFLKCAKNLQLDDEIVQKVHHLYNKQVLNLMDSQSDSGLWHNILNNNETFLETSSSAMFLTGILRGLKEGLIDIDSIDVEEAWSCVLLAWEGLALKINEDGTIRDIIGGTGIQDNEEDYMPTSIMEYSKASPGVGAVLSALAEMIRLQNGS